MLCLCTDAPRPLLVGVPNVEKREGEATSKRLSDFDREETPQLVGPSTVWKGEHFPRARQDMINVITCTPATSKKDIVALASTFRYLTEFMC